MPLFDEKMSAENGFFFNPDVAIDLCYFERKPLRYVVRIHNLLVSFFFLPRTVSRRKLEHLVGKSHERKEVPDNFSQSEIIGFLKQINYLGLSKI